MNARLRLAAYRAFALKSKSALVSSRELGEKAGVHPTIVRRDLAALRLGKRGTGYNAAVLADQLGRELHRDGSLDDVADEARAIGEVMRAIVRTCATTPSG